MSDKLGVTRNGRVGSLVEVGEAQFVFDRAPRRGAVMPACFCGIAFSRDDTRSAVDEAVAAESTR
ncbi:MAG: hypothetical protein ACFCUG_03005 [Thiotrichales bacterium]